MLLRSFPLVAVGHAGILEVKDQRRFIVHKADGCQIPKHRVPTPWFPFHQVPKAIYKWAAGYRAVYAVIVM